MGNPYPYTSEVSRDQPGHKEEIRPIDFLRAETDKSAQNRHKKELARGDIDPRPAVDESCGSRYIGNTQTVNIPSAKAEGFSQEQLSPLRGTDYF